jgi:hypothetical protein
MCNYLTPECDNINNAHLMVEREDKGGITAYCRICNRTYYLKTNKNGAPNKQEYGKLFYRDIVQPNKPLYYKIHKDRLKLGMI